MKKLFFGFLIVVMLFWLLPVSFSVPVHAQEEEVVDWAGFVRAYERLRMNGGRILLRESLLAPSGDQGLFSSGSEGAKVDILMEGHTLSLAGTRLSFGSGLVFHGGGTSGNMIHVSGSPEGEGRLTLEGALIRQPLGNSAAAVTVSSSGRLEMFSGEIHSYQHTLLAESGSTLHLRGGVLSADGNQATGITVEKDAILSIGGDSLQIVVRGNNSSGIVAAGQAVMQEGASIVGHSSNSRGVVTAGAGTFLMTGGAIRSDGIGILHEGTSVEIAGGFVRGAGYGISASKDLWVKGGTVEGAFSAVEQWTNRFSMTGGLLDGVNHAVLLRANSQAILYGGTLSHSLSSGTAVGFAATGNPSLIWYADLDWDESLDKTATQTGASKRQSFSLLSPLSVNLVEGKEHEIPFQIRGQHPTGGALLTMGDFLGTGGTLWLESGGWIPFKVSGNRVTFSPNRSGEGLLVLRDVSTYTGEITIPVRVAAAQETGGTDEDVQEMTLPVLSRTQTYVRGQFSDIQEGSWYGFDRGRGVADAYEFGVMQGKGIARFDPSGSVTLAEAVTMSARLHAMIQETIIAFRQGSPWYEVYSRYALENQLIGVAEFDDPTRAATRAEVASLLARALPSGSFPAINQVKSLPDVHAGTRYASDILTLYRAGVLMGSDEAGTFHPHRQITRAEAASVVSRVLLPVKRVSGIVYGGIR